MASKKKEIGVAVPAAPQPAAQPLQSTASVKIMEARFGKETKQHWQYDITFNGITVGTIYAPKIIIGGERPSDEQIITMTPKPKAGP